jgi:phospholipid/cholesterol/gamma-HCH transport system permease protein
MDRLGTAYELITVRLFGPQVVGIILAGAAGTAICADLGARVIREEIQALEVMGVEPVRNLVVPRVLALAAAGFLFTIFALLAGLLGLVLVCLQYGADFGPVFSTFFASATPLDLQASILKSGIFGIIVAVVCTYKGLHVSGGPEGVGRAVNQAVVISFLAIAFTDYVFTQLLLATSPELTEVRG